jgi:hypothetical protein
MAEFEAVGDAMTGGLLARAIEPAAGEAAGGAAEDVSACLNCGTEFRGDYCGRCGQKRKVHRTISAIGKELLHGVLHLDGKLWNTLPLLALHPGVLTRRYIHGERAKFVSPFSMFLFSVFLMFAVLQVGMKSPSELDMASPVQMRRDLDLLRIKMVAQLDELREDRAKVAMGKRVRHRGMPQTIASIDARIAQIELEIGKLEGIRAEAGRLQFNENKPNAQVKIIGPAIVLEEFERNPGLAAYKLQSNSYKFSWLLIPISAPFVWLLFLRSRRFRFYDHIVFITYSMAFMSLLTIALTVMAIVGAHPAIISIVVALIPPIHMYRHLKEAYELGRLSALGRTSILLLFCLTITCAYLILLLVMIG